MAFTLTESLKGMSVEDFLGLTEWKLGYFGVRSATPADAPRFKDCTTKKAGRALIPPIWPTRPPKQAHSSSKPGRAARPEALQLPSPLRRTVGPLR